MSGHATLGRFARRVDRTARRALVLCFLAFSTLPGGAAELRAPTELAVDDPSPSFPAASMPVASAVRVVQSGETTRLAFDITAEVDVRAFVMADPDRVIVDIPETIFAVEADAGQRSGDRKGRKGPESAPSGLISSYRFGKLGPGRSRIVVELGRPARVLKAASEVSDEGRIRLLLDLAPIDRASFKAAAADAIRSATPANARPAAALPPADRSRPVVVIDPGHGGIDVGALVKGRAPEKDIVFAFARELEKELALSGRYIVVLTRTDDVFVPLGERVQIARSADADLFLSIHADNLSEGGVSGATVYTVSDKASDAHAARLAEKENFADKIAGFDGAEEASGVSDILFDLTRRETRAYSHVFARTLVSVWKDAARLNKNPLRAAGFKVLKAPDVPSALLELGYLSSEKDSSLLTDPEWRAKTATAVARSIDQFFAMRSPTRAAEEKSGVASITR